MPEANKMGMNRTGIAMSPDDAKQMISGAEELTEVGPINLDPANEIRSLYSSPEARVGSIPVPGTFKGLLKTGKEKVLGHNPEVLVNKLGQRLAFERAGVRIYDALIFKCESVDDPLSRDVVSIESLMQFRDEEQEHFLLLKEIVESLGADPTAQTPDADVSALASIGIPKVISEPRTTVLQCLEAVQTAELTDNAAWQVLIELCDGMGMTEMSDIFEKPLAQEKIHAETLKDWISKLVLMESGEK